jgi:hypothetical protein
MNTRTLASAVLLAIGAAAASPAVFAADAVVVTKHHYVYYGDHQIYFAPETKTYYWQKEGRWESGTTLPAESQVYVKTGGVDLDLDTERPYERHEWVVKHYRDKHDSDDHGH